MAVETKTLKATYFQAVEPECLSTQVQHDVFNLRRLTACPRRRRVPPPPAKARHRICITGEIYQIIDKKYGHITAWSYYSQCAAPALPPAPASSPRAPSPGSKRTPPPAAAPRCRGARYDVLKAKGLKATYYQGVETQALSMRGQPDVNLHRPTSSVSSSGTSPTFTSAGHRAVGVQVDI